MSESEHAQEEDLNEENLNIIEDTALNIEDYQKSR
jgi:hypothetical protein